VRPILVESTTLLVGMGQILMPLPAQATSREGDPSRVGALRGAPGQFDRSSDTISSSRRAPDVHPNFVVIARLVRVVTPGLLTMSPRRETAGSRSSSATTRSSGPAGGQAPDETTRSSSLARERY
jgi:hypothetical protein